DTARRGLRLDARGDALCRPDPARRRRRRPRRSAARDDRRRRRGAGRDRSERRADRARAQQDRPRRPAWSATAGESVPVRAAAFGRDGRRARGAPQPDRRRPLRPLRRRALAPALRRGRPSERALCARRSERRAQRPRGGRADPGSPASPRATPMRLLPHRPSAPRLERDAAMIELPIRRLHDAAVLPAHAYEGDAGLDLAAAEAATIAPGERATVGTGLALELPEGYAGFVLPRSGLAAQHGISVVNGPGLIDAGYRGEVRVV